MIIPFAFLLGSLAFLFYKSKEEVTLVNDLSNEVIEEENEIYKDLEDLFIWLEIIIFALNLWKIILCFYINLEYMTNKKKCKNKKNCLKVKI